MDSLWLMGTLVKGLTSIRIGGTLKSSCILMVAVPRAMLTKSAQCRCIFLASSGVRRWKSVVTPGAGGRGNMRGIASINSIIRGIDVSSFEPGSRSFGRGNLLWFRFSSLTEERESSLAREEVDSALVRP